MAWVTSVCLIPGIIQTGSGEALSTPIHRDLSQKTNVVQCLKIGKGVVGGRRRIMKITEQRKRGVGSVGKGLITQAKGEELFLM